MRNITQIKFSNALIRRNKSFSTYFYLNHDPEIETINPCQRTFEMKNGLQRASDRRGPKRRTKRGSNKAHGTPLARFQIKVTPPGVQRLATNK